jgi:hypothetical protein
MPSLEQRRWEAFANAVDKTRKQASVPTVFGGWSDALDIHVETRDGESFDMRLVTVDLDGAELVGQRKRRAFSLPLARVKTVWHHKRRIGRALGIWFAILAGCGAAGMLVAGTSGATGGALLGTMAGTSVLLWIDKWEALYEWTLLYEATI